MECFWLSWVLVLWPIPGLRRFDRDASAPWPSPTCRSRECWTSGQARRWPCGPETRRNAPGWPSRRPRRPLSEAGGLAQGPRNRLDRFEPLAEPRDAGTEIGRASCRESVWQYVSVSEVAVTYQNK